MLVVIYFVISVVFFAWVAYGYDGRPSKHQRREERLKLHDRLCRHRGRTRLITQPHWRARYDELFGKPLPI